jgi:hypothetical protein
MISTQGMTSMLAIGLIDRERDVFKDGVKNEAIARREIEAFKDRIGTISSVKELQDDYEVYSFVMKTFGLEEEIYAKAMNAKIMTSDPDDRTSLVNRLTRSSFKSLNETMGFEVDGLTDGRFESTAWVDSMVDRYVEQRLIDNQTNTNKSVGVALDFERKASGLTSWYKVLSDKDVSGMLRVALGIPGEVATGDIDAQKKIFERKMDIKDLQDSDIQKSLIRKYAAISDANNAALRTPNAAVALLSSSTTSGTWSIVTLDIDLVRAFR